MAGLAFLTPWLLWGLLSLPALYFLLRATPPAPILRKFPAVALLMGLQDEENTPDRTPWWLLLLRLAAIAALIIGFAGPILNPDDRVSGRGPLVVALDASWASAQDWQRRTAKVAEIIAQAEQDDRPVALIQFSDAPKGALQFGAAGVARDKIAGLAPRAWAPDYAAWKARLTEEDFNELIWFSDGLDHEGRADLRSQIDAKITVVQSDRGVIGISPMTFEDGEILTSIKSLSPSNSIERVEVLGLDPSGSLRVLALEEVEVTARSQDVKFELPTELRNRVRQVRLQGVRSAGAIALTDDSIRSRKIALISAKEAAEGGLLLSSLHYVREALSPTADLIETDLETALLANPDIFIFADIGRLPAIETDSVLEWIEEGGTLVRFAGPRLIASEIGQREEHPLLPVRLRSGGRDLGGAMSWGEPKKLRVFDENSPFFGLQVPEEVSVASQVLAQPDPNLSDRVLARLEDGTPLVTAKDHGAGRVVLFHTTANAAWTDLPLSGLFLKMLERLSIGSGARSVSAEAMQGLVWKPRLVINGVGDIMPADGLAGIDGALLAEPVLGEDLQPGLYENQDRAVAVNVISGETDLKAAQWPATTERLSLTPAEARDLKPIFLSFGILVLLIDILASLAVSGRLFAKIAAVVLALNFAHPADAQDEADIIEAVNNTVLAYVITGDPRMDETSHAGLRGLSAELYRRTAI
ncbi:MAG: BatA domain-containing protein, partial [Pseudomonadota bacterium]